MASPEAYINELWCYTLFSKLRVTYFWNVGVGRRGQRTKEMKKRGDAKACLISV